MKLVDTPRKSPTRGTGPREVWHQVVAGLIVAAIVTGAGFLITRALDDQDAEKGPTPLSHTTSTTAPPPNPPVDVLSCIETACPQLTVFDTVTNGHDDGLYVKACSDSAVCERLALAQLDQRIYAQCRVEDGLAIEGVTTWIRTPWAFVPGSVAPDGSANAAATGKSDPSSDDYGWVSARYLAPPSVIDALPLCS